jgi:2-C-methyl-D-erythritol 4-phosphate cytidylyltransferase
VSVGVVIPAAGIGKRMCSTTPKQFLTLSGEPILVHTLHIFEHHPDITEIIVVANREDKSFVKELLAKKGLSKVKRIVIGGRERQDSVYQGVLATTTEWVLVHDGVRPFVSQVAVTRLINAMKEGERAATLAVPVKDTIKRVSPTRVVEETLDRSNLWNIQTPQVFSKNLLLSAHQHAIEYEIMATDDAMLVEAIGEKVHVVEGEYTNLKITTPEDLLIGEAILARKGQLS